MLKRINYAVAVLFLLGACGPPPPPPPPPFTPVGVYDLVIAAQGMTIAGTLSIEEASESGYTGYIDTEMGGTSISNIMVDGTTVTFSIAEVGADVELQIEGEDVVGGMTGAMGQAGITGTRRPEGG